MGWTTVSRRTRCQMYETWYEFLCWFFRALSSNFWFQSLHGCICIAPRWTRCRRGPPLNHTRLLRKFHLWSYPKCLPLRWLRCLFADDRLSIFHVMLLCCTDFHHLLLSWKNSRFGWKPGMSWYFRDFYGLCFVRFSNCYALFITLLKRRNTE